MSGPSDKSQDVRTRLIGLGERSVRKTYYPELRERLGELERFRTLLNQATDAILVLDAENLSFVDANETAARLTRRTVQGLLDLPPGAVLDQGAMRALAEALSEAMRRNRSGVRELTAGLLRADGVSVPCDLSLRVAGFESRRYVLVAAKDISRRLADQRALREREAYYQAIVEAFDGEIFICDQDYRIEFANAQFIRRLGRDPRGEPCHKALQGLDEQCPWCAAGPVAEARTGRFEVRDRESGRWSQVIQSPIHHPDGRVSRQVMSWDITARKEMEEQLRRQALHDPLTGLANRTLCHTRVALAQARLHSGREGSFAVLFVDVDRFKILNDSLGHSFGDALLLAVGARLLAGVREGDTVARYGGDEFLVLLDAPRSRREAVRAAKNIVADFRRGFDVEGRHVHLTASVGLVFPQSGEESAADLLQDSDIAMQWAKRRGGDRLKVFTPSMRENARKRLMLESDMREGLARGDFFLVFQPVVGLKGGPRLSGMEALLRWRHPEKGLIGPGEFIPVAEETGLIVDLGRWVLFRACEAMVRFREAEPRAEALTMSVNVSGRQLDNTRFLDHARQALEQSGLPGECLRLEVTETAIMRNPEFTALTLARLKGLGIGISVDDFGRGYSSMSYLRQLPLDVLKIDLSFVRKMLDSQADMEIVKAIINLAHNLDLKVVAEGVERREQQNMLMLLDCEYAQGFYYAKPQEEDALLQTIRDYAPGRGDGS
ncbi:EAL domain-containing protein [Desulfovibrio aminophilus]|uniref:putative bifunctional diguanylate cyclase/phosphodiesterase n=1 Tax=Desulfovibrio aminophilus TaxID=81425 RepID=UPI00339184C1